MMYIAQARTEFQSTSHSLHVKFHHIKKTSLLAIIFTELTS
jgi:hypothetical protein